MHKSIILIVIFISSVTLALPNKVDYFEAVINKIKSSWFPDNIVPKKPDDYKKATADLKKMISDLKVLKSKFDLTITEYKNENPEKANSEEEKVVSLFFALEHLFILVDGKVTTDSCDSAKHRIKMEDSVQDDGKLSAVAQTAYELTAIVCEKLK